jgi:hypothetical protein
MTKLKRSFIYCAAVAAWSSFAVAQTTNAVIVGDVTDPQNAIVAGAKITVKDLATGVTRTVETNNLGQYRVFPLLPGSYEVTASAAGFRSKVQPKVVLDVAAQMKVDFQLDVGQVSETVEVSASAPILQTQDASVGGVVTSTELARMPVNGRNYTRLILLLPGTSDRGGSQSQGTFSGTALYSVNGQRQQDNNYTVDGVDNNFFLMNSPGASPPMDAIQEFKVLNNTSAEFGRSAGANVNIAIKSGTRDLHGSAYEYLRNDKFDANDFFNNRQGVGKLPFRQNQYGFSLGGPVVLPKLYNGRDKTFWFFDWEGFRERQGRTQISTTPIEAQRGGDFSQQPRTIYDPFTSVVGAGGALVRQPFANNMIPKARINQAISYYVDTVMPLPNRSGISNNLINTQGLANDRDVWNVRLDHTFGSKDNVFFRYSSQDVGQVSPNANLNFYNTSRFDGRNMAAAWNHIFSATTVLETKFGYNNPSIPTHDVDTRITRSEFLQKSGITMFQPDVLFDPIPNLNAVGEFSVPNNGSNAEDHVYQAIANFSKTLGRHTFKVGMSYNWREFFTNTANPMNGSADFSTALTNLSTDKNSGESFATMLLGTPTAIRRALGNTFTEARGPFQNYYVQDDWRLSSKLTVNLGLRYEYNTPAYALNDQKGTLLVVRDQQSGQYSANFLWAGTNPLTGEGPNTMGLGRALQAPDRKDFAPRVGFAYQIDSKTVIRSAYGIFYDSTFFQELQDKRKFWPYTQQQLITPNTGTIPDLLITDAGPPFSSGIGGWPQDPHKRTPYSQQWNLTIQRQLMNDLSLEVGYVGSGNRHQIGYTTWNQATAPGPGPVDPRRLLNNIPGLADLDGGVNLFTSNYESLRVSAVKRFSKGLQFNVNYTWGKVLTTQSSLAEEIDQNQFNRRADYGRASFDIRHAFQAAYVYELPFGKGKRYGGGWPTAADLFLGGWSVEGITRLETGAPVNVTLGLDRANIGKSAQRPDLIANPNIGGNRNVSQPWFDLGAFQLPAIYTYGNAAPYVVDTDGRESWDFALQKDFVFRETQNIQFRTEFFNLPNHVNFNSPNGTFTSSSFGLVTSATAARQIQFGLRYSF